MFGIFKTHTIPMEHSGIHIIREGQPVNGNPEYVWQRVGKDTLKPVAVKREFEKPQPALVCMMCEHLPICKAQEQMKQIMAKAKELEIPDFITIEVKCKFRKVNPIDPLQRDINSCP